MRATSAFHALLCVLFLSGALSSCLYVSQRQVFQDSRHISQETLVERWIFYRAVPAAGPNALSVSFGRFEAAKSRREDKYETRVRVIKDLKFQTDFESCGLGCGQVVCTAGALIASPVWIPLQLLSARDEDRGIQIRTDETPLAETETETAWTGKHQIQIGTGTYPEMKIVWEDQNSGPLIQVPYSLLRGQDRITVFLEPENPEKRQSWVFRLRWEGDRLLEILAVHSNSGAIAWDSGERQTSRDLLPPLASVSQ